MNVRLVGRARCAARRAMIRGRMAAGLSVVAIVLIGVTATTLRIAGREHPAGGSPGAAATAEWPGTSAPKANEFCPLMMKLTAGGLRSERPGVRYNRVRLGSGEPVKREGALRLRVLCVKPDRTVLMDSRKDGQPVVWTWDQLPSLGLRSLWQSMRAGDLWRVMALPDRVLVTDPTSGELASLPPDQQNPPLQIDELRLYEIEVLEVLDADGARQASADIPLPPSGG